MKFCTYHWDALRAAIDSRGLSHLVARTGEAARERMKAELTGTATDATYDPLMAAHWMIASRVAQQLNNPLLHGDLCPICEVLTAFSKCRCAQCAALSPDEKARMLAEKQRSYIEGPADAVLKYCRDHGLVQVQ